MAICLEFRGCSDLVYAVQMKAGGVCVLCIHSSLHLIGCHFFLLCSNHFNQKSIRCPKSLWKVVWDTSNEWGSIHIAFICLQDVQDFWSIPFGIVCEIALTLLLQPCWLEHLNLRLGLCTSPSSHQGLSKHYQKKKISAGRSLLISTYPAAGN